MSDKNYCTEEHYTHMETRVGRLEGTVATLADEVGKISSSVKELTAGMGSFKEQVLSHIGQATAPKWPLIAGITSMVFTIVTLLGSVFGVIITGVNSNIYKIEQTLVKMQEHLIDSERVLGQQEAWNKYHEQMIKDMSSCLQLSKE